MAECVCLPKCIFFNDKMAGMPTTAQRMKQKFCTGNSSDCARYMVFEKLGRDKVPGDLFPHQKERALELIQG
jgi:hypothetical protein